MATKRYIPVKAYAVYLECPRCGEDMRFNGKTVLVMPPQYEHECLCHYKQLIPNQTYPTIEWINEDGDDVEV